MKVHELLDCPERWTKGTMGRDKCGRPTLRCNFESDAVSFCLLGAIYRCYPAGDMAIRDRVGKALKDRIVDWNDAPERTFEEVRTLALELDI